MPHKTTNSVCAVCVLFGVIAPWLLLVASALMSVFSSSDYWKETAAYLAAAGVIWLAASYLLAHVVNNTYRA